MTTNFEFLSADEPPYSDSDTEIDDDTRPLDKVTLPILANENRTLVTMVHRDRDVYPDIENIRVGSLVYFVSKSNGYRVGFVQ